MSFSRSILARLLVIVIALPSMLPVDLGDIQSHTLSDSHVAQPLSSLETDNANQRSGSNLYFPQVFNADRIVKDEAIWAHNSFPAAHEVTLFRHRFSLKESLAKAELHLFADTRYEIWLDGAWIGRGPARFSSTLHEYDIYRLGSLPPGEHLLAVLVQWAPNTRRSESTRPHLTGHIQGQVGEKIIVSTRTGSDWKFRLSNAWQNEAAPVHAWGLIGPTELLDLGGLPANWNQPGFNDTNWTTSVVIPAPQAIFQPRSIPYLVEYPLVPAVIDAGEISPGYRLGEIAPPFSDPFVLEFSNTSPATFTMQALAIPSETAAVIRLDGSHLTWEDIDPDRPDLYAARAVLLAGDHDLSFEGIPVRGMTFAVPAQNFQYSQFPFNQGLHAGRRTLLADLNSNLSLVNVSSAPELKLDFSRLPAYAILDLGRTVIGRLHAQVEGPAGTLVDIGWDERLVASSQRPLPYPGTLHPEWNQVDSWILDGSSRAMSTIDVRAGRYILVALWGDGPVEIRDIRVLEEQYPSPVVGSFHSSLPNLDRFWQVGLDTLRPNMLDGYTDTPWRERGQWSGDAYIGEHINRVSLGDMLLLKRGLRYMANALSNTSSPGLAPNSSGTHMLDYTMLWVASLAEYIQLSADRPFLRIMYPVLQKFVAHQATLENKTTGLLDLPQAPWSQTAYIESRGYHSRYGMSTALNAGYYHTLQQAGYLADLAGDPVQAAAWRDKAVAVRQKVNELLYLPAEGRYATNIYQDEIYPPTPHAQAWALAYDLVPPEHVDQVASALVALLSPDPQNPNLDIYGMYWVLEALGKSDHIAEGLAILENYYGYLLDSGATAWWERFDANRYQSASLSHVWGGSPTWFLSTYLLGAKWEGPATWSVRPAFSGVSHAAGSIPLDDGLLDVEWERPMCKQGFIEISAPKDTSGEIIIPFAELILRVTQDGSVVWKKGQSLQGDLSLSADGMIIPITGGNYSLSVDFDC